MLEISKKNPYIIPVCRVETNWDSYMSGNGKEEEDGKDKRKATVREELPATHHPRASEHG